MTDFCYGCGTLGQFVAHCNLWVVTSKPDVGRLLYGRRLSTNRSRVVIVQNDDLWSTREGGESQSGCDSS